MIATKPAELRMKLKDYLQKAFDGETVIVARPRNENTIIISEEYYNRLMQERRLMAYYMKMKESGMMTEKEDESYSGMILDFFSGKEKMEKRSFKRKRGALSDGFIWIADDFDECSDGWEDYM